MTFKEYLAARRVTDTPAGDFTGDARSDRELPDVTTWDQLRSYLERKAGFGIQEEVINAGHEVWRGYQRALKRGR
jgi:hypothetical protein